MSLLALFVTALTACAIAHPGGLGTGSAGRSAEPLSTEDLSQAWQALGPSKPLDRQLYRDYLVPRYLMPRPILPEQARGRIPYPPPQLPASDWLNEEIERINRMEERSQLPYRPKSEVPPWLRQATHDTYKRIFGPVSPFGTRAHVAPYFEYPSKALMAAAAIPRKHLKLRHQPLETANLEQEPVTMDIKKKNDFALTPLDDGYFAPTELNHNSHTYGTVEGRHEGGGKGIKDEVDRRPIRQNPNLSRTKTLVATDLDSLRQGVGSEESVPTDKSKPVHMFGTEFFNGSFYSVGVTAGVGTALILAIAAFTFGWYTLSKRAKAAAEVDYPAYGVTGPNVDSSGDRKLAHSAQMYHYQHQKQQIIAMERNNAEQRNGSVSDPESEEENEEGDYTVYECPGFATTGEMEVKNPLFHDDSTPATPGKIKVVKPQPKE